MYNTVAHPLGELTQRIKSLFIYTYLCPIAEFRYNIKFRPCVKVEKYNELLVWAYYPMLNPDNQVIGTPHSQVILSIRMPARKLYRKTPIHKF